MIEFSYRKGVYMLVSAVTANSIQTVFSTGIKNQDIGIKKTLNSLQEIPETTEKDKISIFDSINEWKYFCHKQILEGKLDIIASLWKYFLKTQTFPKRYL